VPRSRRESFAALTGALADGRIDLSAGGDWAEARLRLTALAGDRAVDGGGPSPCGPSRPGCLPGRRPGRPRGGPRARLPGTPAALSTRSAAWRPWRAYAVQYLWATSDHAINRLPGPRWDG